MSSSHLRLRENWQTLSGNLASVAEQNFADVFNNSNLLGLHFIQHIAPHLD